MSHAKQHLKALIAVAAATVLVVALASCGGEESSPSPSGAHGGTVDGKRTVEVFVSEPVPSPSDSDGVHTGLEQGNLPAGPVQATVLTDEDCAPDREGVSHCRNEMMLAGGATVVLRHHHDMMDVPCLEPGEDVVLNRV